MTIDAFPTAALDSSSSSDIPMFKTEHKYNINITSLVKAARDNIDCVRLIAVPSVVRKQQRRGEQCESPTMSEIGGGSDCDFCQVVAGVDGLPVNIDDIVFVNSDPEKFSINHGTAVVTANNYFAVGWKRHSDRAILIYRILNVEEYEFTQEQLKEREEEKEQRPIAKLTCGLAGHSISSWRGTRVDVPDFLRALLSTVELRMITDFHAPLFMDVIRMMPPTTESAAISERMKNGDYGNVQECDAGSFMTEIYSEILDVREAQYRSFPPDAKRKIEPLRAVQTLQLSREDDTVTIEMVIPRADGEALTNHYRVVLDSENFFNSYGKMSLERNLVLKCSSFDRLRSELSNKRDQTVVVNLASIR